MSGAEGPTSTRFKAGELVALRATPDTRVPVLEVLPGHPESRYRVFQNNAISTYYESQLRAARQDTSIPRADSRGVRGRLTAHELLSPSVTNLLSLGAGRVNFVPYQYRPVLKMIRADRPRLLIADEVGVGKTIEAGLILKELQARTDLQSVLIICPRPLVAERKWFAEMKRFDEHFIALDGKTLRHCLEETHLEGEWPEAYSKAILPFSLFDAELIQGGGRGRTARRGLLSLDPPPRFDLVIVDEAHHIRNSDTWLHQGVRYFCDHAQAVVMLTATPVQLGSEDLYTLLNVLRPDLVVDPASFQQMAAPNRHINEAARLCRVAGPDWQASARASLAEVTRTEWGQLFLADAPGFQAVTYRLRGGALDDASRVQLIRDIEALYTFSAVINRTRRRDIGAFTTRKPRTVELPFTPRQRELHDELITLTARLLERAHGDQNVSFMMTTLRRMAASCLYGLAPALDGMLRGRLDALEVMEASDREGAAALDPGDLRDAVARVSRLSRDLDPVDPKVEAFLTVLREKAALPRNKTLVFSSFRHTLAYLLDHAQRAGLRVAVIHGDVPDEERRELRRRFALERQDADAIDVLLSSEVGCEGLDFQFCDMLVNYDLPWNPMRIEQRIGRIDRYGQTSEAVAIVNLVTPGTVDAEIYHRCLLRIGVFHQAVGGSEEILGEISHELQHIAESFTLADDERARQLQQLADNSIRHVQEQQALEAQQAELFGLTIPAGEWDDQLEDARSTWLSPAALQHTVNTYLAARLGIEPPLEGDRPVRSLRLGQSARDRLLEDFLKLPRSAEPPHRAWEKWLKGAQPLLTITFEQDAAREAPDATHLSVTHPLVRQAARFLDAREPRETSLRVTSAELPPGVHPFALYHWSRLGARPDETLVPVAASDAVARALPGLLHAAVDADLPPPDQQTRESLDATHYQAWAAAQAEHLAANRRVVEFRMQSLRVSHRARALALEDQVRRAKNEKIRLMKASELARANADFERRLTELEHAAASGDIRATPVLFGSLEVIEDDQP